MASDIAYKIKNNRKLNDNDISRGYLIYENVWQHNPELLEEADNLAEQDRIKASEIANAMSNPIDCRDEITLELIKKMVEWDKRRRILEDWKWKAMKDVADGIKTVDRQDEVCLLFQSAEVKEGWIFKLTIEMDIWSREKRSEVMSRIRNKGTKPEIMLRKALLPADFAIVSMSKAFQKTGYSSATIQNCNFRSWMFLARTSWL